MIRRNILTVAAAAALVLAPSAAFGYGAQDYVNKGTVSDSTPASGQVLAVTVPNAPGAKVQLTVKSNPESLPDSAITIAGVRTAEKTADAAGNAVFSVTLTQAGTYTIVGTDVATGTTLYNQAVTVAAAAGARAAALPTTGSDALPLGLGAGALVLAGAGAVVVAKRRRGVTAA
jgi:LPXTG-motif cell wall-anchored protein